MTGLYSPQQAQSMSGGLGTLGSHPFNQMVNSRQQQATKDMLAAARGMPMRPPISQNALVDAAANLSQNMGLIPQSAMQQIPQMPQVPQHMQGGPPGGGGMPMPPPPQMPQAPPPIPGSLASQVQPPGTLPGQNVLPQSPPPGGLQSLVG